jgi:hypothetical protein
MPLLEQKIKLKTSIKRRRFTFPQENPFSISSSGVLSFKEQQ